MIKYISTRSDGEPQSFEQVLLQGLAPDGGLYVPKTWPMLDLQSLKGKPYIDVAFAVMFPFVEGCISDTDFRSILEEVYSTEIFQHKDVTPLHHLKDNLYTLELFHGPTIAFKDVALQLLGRLFDHVLTKRNEHVTIIGATSGDTGSAAIEGCYHSGHVNIFILHPAGRVSDVQRKQMTTVNAPNVHNIAVEGTFDDCQNAVKAMFNDETFRTEMNLCAVNSINWARIMAQIVYYVTSALELGAPEKDVSFVVPTGNFGNIFAAYCARKMGLPIKTLAIATNKNDILTRFFETGTMQTSEVSPSISPSMDIQISSNFERYLFDATGRDAKKLCQFMNIFSTSNTLTPSDLILHNTKREFKAFRTLEEETQQTIAQIHKETGYILDPHTAVGMHAALKIATEEDGAVVSLACAHPAKFPDAVEQTIGLRPELPAHLADLFERTEHVSALPNDLSTIQSFIRKRTKLISQGAAKS